MPVTDNAMHGYVYNSCNILCNMQQLLDYMSQYLIVKLWVAASYAYLGHGITGLWDEHHLQVGHKHESWHWRKHTPDLLYQQEGSW